MTTAITPDAIDFTADETLIDGGVHHEVVETYYRDDTSVEWDFDKIARAVQDRTVRYLDEDITWIPATSELRDDRGIDEYSDDLPTVYSSATDLFCEAYELAFREVAVEVDAAPQQWALTD